MVERIERMTRLSDFDYPEFKVDMSNLSPSRRQKTLWRDAKQRYEDSRVACHGCSIRGNGCGWAFMYCRKCQTKFCAFYFNTK